MRSRYVIVGNGAAGVTAAEEIRRRDPHGQIAIVGGEPYPMYSRPGLAYVLTDEVSGRQVMARRPEWYGQHRLRLIYAQAARLDVGARHIELDKGPALLYDRLLIATGARAIPPPYPNADLQGVVYLDTLDGTRDLMRQVKTACRAVVIGGGITALELTEGLAHQGLETHYFVRRNRIWGRVFTDLEAILVEQRMAAEGVTTHHNAEVVEILGDDAGHVRGVRLKNGEEFECDLVGVAIGVRPQLELVQDTPIKVERGILVDEYLQTNVAGIYAAGDCAQVYDRWTQSHMLDILWPSAVAEGRAAGVNMTGGELAYVKSMPFNACLLFGLHITIIGQIVPQRDGGGDDDLEVVQHLSRGSSEIWDTHPRQHYASAWVQDGPNTLRLVLSGDHLVGAVIVGEQSMADPLRHLIENQVDVRPLRPYLRTGGLVLRQRLEQFWQELNVGDTRLV